MDTWTFADLVSRRGWGGYPKGNFVWEIEVNFCEFDSLLNFPGGSNHPLPLSRSTHYDWVTNKNKSVTKMGSKHFKNNPQNTNVITFNLTFFIRYFYACVCGKRENMASKNTFSQFFSRDKVSKSTIISVLWPVKATEIENDSWFTWISWIQTYINSKNVQR